MRVRSITILICIGLLLTLCSCTIRSDKKISEDVLNKRKEAHEKYLKETYPGQEFTVKVWQEYGEDIGGAGLPDYEGYLIKEVVTDSEGNRFKVHGDREGEYYDDYKKVLDGWIEYDEKGDMVFKTDKDKNKE